MKRSWKIAFRVVALLAVVAGAVFMWNLTQPPAPARLVAPGPTGQRIDAGGILANYYPAKSAGNNPAILLLGGSEGGLGKDARQQAVLLQQQGFNTLQLAYHNAPGKSAKLEEIPLEEFYRGLDWLKQQSGVDASRLGIIGYSKGAEAGLLVATRYPGISAVVLGMPSSVVWDGMSGVNYIFGSFSSSWSEKGRSVPHLAYKGFPDNTGLLPVFVNGLKELSKNQPAIIPVEKFNGKLMLVCGQDDTVWPSCPMTDQIVGRAKEKNGPDIVALKYDDAGHGVMGAPFVDPKRRAYWSKLGGTQTGNAEARADSWPKITTFLKAELGLSKGSQQ